MQKKPQQKQLMNSTEFYDVYQVTKTILEIKEDVFKAAVEQYLDKNKISGIKYTLESINYSFYPARVEIHLKCGIFEPCENFYSDDSFMAFCEDLANKSGALWVCVPHYYYSK